ncbi:hypothetical protein [Robinsoniella peoriensis]|uniref:hypothetical protein n=1 Tax=Robinsoniella peoriensis TaxID=180332 RepID=UPI00085C552A|nr:hypothetical protein [Robinsoniella peoriensis]
MKNDVIINKYLSDNERFADLYNHQVFRGMKQLLEFERLAKTEEGGIDMCKAIDEMILEGEQRGEQKGKLKGELIGFNLWGDWQKRCLRMEKQRNFLNLLVSKIKGRICWKSIRLFE